MAAWLPLRLMPGMLSLGSKTWTPNKVAGMAVTVVSQMAMSFLSTSSLDRCRSAVSLADSSCGNLARCMRSTLHRRVLPASVSRILMASLTSLLAWSKVLYSLYLMPPLRQRSMVRIPRTMCMALTMRVASSRGVSGSGRSLLARASSRAIFTWAMISSIRLASASRSSGVPVDSARRRCLRARAAE